MNPPDPKTASPSEFDDRKRARRLAGCPVSARTLLTRCWSKKCSPRQVLKALCHECQALPPKMLDTEAKNSLQRIQEIQEAINERIAGGARMRRPSELHPITCRCEI